MYKLKKKKNKPENDEYKQSKEYDGKLQYY